MTHRTPPTTPAAFRRDAEAALRRRNPDNLRLVWTTPPHKVVWPSGKAGFTGTLRAVTPDKVRVLNVTLRGTTLAGF